MPSNTPIRTHRDLFTDYDDTLVCSGAGPLAIAGTDTSYPRHTPYPGMRELVCQLIATPTSSRPHTSHTSRKRSSSSPTIYISTARPDLPGLRKDAHIIQRTLRLRHPPTLLYGDSRVGAQWVTSRLWDHTCGEGVPSSPKSPHPPSAPWSRTFRQRIKRQMGHTKFQSWLRAKGPDGPSVFLGDSGQGDIYAALEMLQYLSPCLSRYTSTRTRKASSTGTHPSRPPAFRAYIHHLDHPTNHPTTRQLPLAAYNVPPAARRHICVYRTTLEAAIDAHQHGLIHTTGLKRVQRAYRAAIRTIPCVFQATDTSTQRRRWWTFVPHPTKRILGYLYPGQRGDLASASAWTKMLTPVSNDSKVVPRYPFRPPSRQTISYATFERTGLLRYVGGKGATGNTGNTGTLEPSTTGTRGSLCDIGPMLNRVVLGECLRVL
jgi:hypothetical protein